MVSRLRLPEERVRIAPSGISLDGYRDLPRERSSGFPPALGFFARMCPEKGLDTLVDAYLEIRRRGRIGGLRLKVGGGCGPGDQAFVDAQRARLAAAGLDGDASFHPNVSREEKVSFLGSLDVLSVPARFSEAFGLYIVESMAAGTPVVQPDVCGFREMIEKTGGGLLCEPGSVGALADAIEALLLDPARARALGNAGRRGVEAGFSDAVMAREVVRSVDSLIGGAAA
jgi:glycosyltransferase involved in cell wall biosynthesis